MDYNYQIRLRRGTSTQWELSDPILLDGEPGYDTTLNYYKIGDGVRRWSELPWTTGLKGDPATVDAGSTTTIDPDSPAKVTNAGTTQNAIFDFEIPEGKPGKDLFIHEGSAQNPPVDWLPRELLWDPDAEPTVDDIPFGNLLTPNQASGTNVLGTTAGFDQRNGYNWVGARSFEFPGAPVGSRVLAASQGPTADGFIVMTDKIPIRSDSVLTYTLSAYWNGTLNSKYSQPVHSFYDSAGHRIGSWVYGQVMDCPTQKWFDVSKTIPSSQIPAGTRYISFGFNFPYGNPSGTEAYLDRLGLWEGAGGDWAMPGTPILNQTLQVVAPESVDMWGGEEWIPLVRPLGNLLSDAMASLESGYSPPDTIYGWANDGGTGTLVDGGSHGQKALRITAPTQNWGVKSFSPHEFIPVREGVAYTLSADMKAVTGTREWRIVVNWQRDTNYESGTHVKADVASVRPSAQWRTATGTFIAPPGARFANIRLSPVQVGPAGDACDYDRIGFWEGAGGDWAMPGTPIRNQGRRVSRPNGTDRLVEVWDGAAWCVVHYDSGWRDVTGLLNAGWTAAHVKFRRVDETVHVRIADMHGPGDQFYWVTPPAGFATARSYYVMLTAPDLIIGQEASQVSAVGPGGAKVPASQAIWAEFAWSTDDPLPTSLPGTLISTAP